MSLPLCECRQHSVVENECLPQGTNLYIDVRGEALIAVVNHVNRMLRRAMLNACKAMCPRLYFKSFKSS